MMPHHNSPLSLTSGALVTPLRYAPGDIIKLNADTSLQTELRYVSGGDAGLAFEDLGRPGEFVRYSHMQMADVASSAGYRYLPGGRSMAAAEIKARTGVSTVNELPAAEAKRAAQRCHWVDAFLALEAQKVATRSTEAINAALVAIEEGFHQKKIEAGNRPSARTLRRWLKAYELARNPVDLRAYYMRGYSLKLLDQQVQKFVDSAVNSYLSTNRPSLAAVYSDLSDSIRLANHDRAAGGLDEIKPPCYKVFRAFVAARGEFAVYAARYGAAAAKRKFAMVMDGVRAQRPGERVEVDAWEIPLFALLERSALLKLLSPKQLTFLKAHRWVCCAVIDVASKIILGMRIAPTENADLVLATLEMAMSDKKPYSDAAGATTPWTQRCRPDAAFMDMGSANTGNRVRFALSVCGVDIAYPPAGHPWLRGSIERSFGTDQRELFQRFSGRTFENVAAKGDYKSEEYASLTFQELCDAYVRFKVDVYHNAPHRGLYGETPVNAWRRTAQMYGVNAPPDRETMRLAFGVTLTRVLDNRGVRVLNLHYNSGALHSLLCKIGPKQEVKIKVSRGDLGAVAVEVGDGDWITVPCVRPGMDDVSIAEWMATTAEMRVRFGAEAKIVDAMRLAAIRDLRQLGEAAILRSIGAPLVTQQQIDIAEKSLRFGFTSDETAKSASSDDYLDGLTPAAQPSDPSSSGSAPLRSLPAPDSPEPDAPEKDRPLAWEQEESVRKFGMDD